MFVLLGCYQNIWGDSKLVSCCQPSCQLSSCMQMLLGVCKAFGIFSVLDSFYNSSSFPPVPSTAGPALLAALALEGSAEILGTKRLAALSQGNLVQNMPVCFTTS